MGFARSYLVSLLLYVSIVNEIRLPLVTCQVEESTTFIPKRAIVALLRLLEDSSNSPAYSRTASMIQDVKNRNDIANLRGLSEGNDDCTPSGVYLELFKDPILREYLNMIVRTQRLPDFPRRTMDDSEEGGSRESLSESQKRSIATLAKNDDLPITIYDRVVHNEDDEEKRGVGSSEQSGPNGPQVFHDYAQPNGQLNLEALSEAFPTEKRNVAALARDFALPPGRRNIATSSRDYELPNDKRNVDSVLRERIMQAMGKRSVASLARTSALPQNGKRNVAAIARDYGLPFGKRYIGSLARTVGFPLREQSKRSVATLAKNSNWPVFSKKGLSVPGSVILRTLYRHGRSLNDLNAKQDFVDLQRLNGLEASQSNYYEGDSFGDDAFGASHVRNGSSGKTDSDEENPKSQIDFSDEYPLPVMQNANVFDYEELMEALTGQYPYVEKRFMGRIPQMGPRPTTPPTRRRGH